MGLAALAATIAAAALGFLPWNWAPARIFLGDVGSVPLGFLLGFLLLGVAASGHWKIALILPLYFLADATITLLRRLALGERVWQPHRRHFYQQAVTRGLGHAAVVRRVIGANLLLIGCGWVPLRFGLLSGIGHTWSHFIQLRRYLGTPAASNLAADSTHTAIGMFVSPITCWSTS